MCPGIEVGSGNTPRPSWFTGDVTMTFTVGRFRLRADGNLYNVFNNDFVNSVNTTFSTTSANQFMQPTNILQGRLFKVGGQIEF